MVAFMWMRSGLCFGGLISCMEYRRGEEGRGGGRRRVCMRGIGCERVCGIGSLLGKTGFV